MCQLEGPWASPLLPHQPQGQPTSLLTGPAGPWLGGDNLSPQKPLPKGLTGVSYHAAPGVEVWPWP